jgi:long-chain acyl-CoA synthetase
MSADLYFAGKVRISADLERRGAKLAGGMAALGLLEGDVVAVLLRNAPIYADIIIACRMAGVYYCPINWHFAPPEIAFLLRDSAARLLIGDADLLAAATDAVPVGVRLMAAGVDYETWLERQSPYCGPVVPPRGHMAYTSGTTGRPKGVRRHAGPMAGQKAAQDVADALVRATFGVAPGGRALLSAPIYHSAPSLFAQSALRLAERLVLMPSFDAEETLVMIEAHRIDTVYLVPIMYSRLLALPASVRSRYDVSSLRFVASTGAPCAPDLKRAMIEWLGPVIHETYASSETGMITVINAEEARARPGSAGRPVLDASVRILRQTGEACATGEIGLIYVRQPAVADFSYHNLPDARSAMEKDGHVTLGDMGYLDDDGYLFICDRASDMVISGGVNIYPSEVENALLKNDAVVDCAVFGVPNAEYGESLHAVIQLRPGSLLQAHDLIAGLKGQLAGFKIPRTTEFIDIMPRDANGKLAKRVLRAAHWASSGRQI